MRTLFCGLVLAFSCLTMRAQTAGDSIKMTIDNLFAAVRASDSAALMACFTPDAILQTIVKDKEGNLNVHSVGVASFVSMVGNLPKGAGDERIQYDMIKIDVPLATVWTPYLFYYRGKFSHCGVNSFQLVRLDTGWKVQYIIDTRRKDNCIGEKGK
ncbi:hypothetical protein [Chitinophaga defluvii]|uniref:Lumazine-binding protein n=1 Tax=Chitinophaga defluvii TaxID=3163343 RepID=A0ABV2TCU1_9BACT